MASVAQHLVFLEDRDQVSSARELATLGAGRQLIAVTAEALQALEEVGLPHQPVSAFADARQLAATEEKFNVETFALLREVEAFIGQRYTAARLDGPGFLSGQAYQIQYSISAVATRAFLMLETIRATSPKAVTLWNGAIDPWFEKDGHAENPWIEVVRGHAEELGFDLEILPCSRPAKRQMTSARTFHRRAWRSVARRSRGLIRRWFQEQPHFPEGLRSGLCGMRLLMADGIGFDWHPVLDALRSIKDIECFVLNGSRLDPRVWTYYYSPHFQRAWDRKRHLLHCGIPRPEPSEIQAVASCFDRWAAERPSPPELKVLGMNVLPALMQHLRAMAALGPAIARHTDALTEEAVELARPHAVCFYAMPWLPSQRLAYHCRQRGIPAVCYQHGGTYGTHDLAKNELIEPSHADYFLTYGAGVQPRTRPAFPVKCRYVPVGSSQIERMAARAVPGRSKHGTSLRVLWVAEYSMRNTLGGTFQMEDTERYLLQKQCLEILGQSPGVSVIYRPYPQQGEWLGTTQWIANRRIGSLRIDSRRAMADLIRRSDVVISDTSSGTVWNEVMALQRPLILYCDPRQTLLLPQFMVDLDSACYWCKSSDDMVKAVGRLVQERWGFVEEVKRKEAQPFLQRYVLHTGDQRPVQRVVSFLHSVCRQREPASQWEARCDSVSMDDCK